MVVVQRGSTVFWETASVPPNTLEKDFTQDFSEMKVWFIDSATSRTKQHRVSSRFGSIFSRHLFFKEFGTHFSWEAKERDASAVSATHGNRFTSIRFWAKSPSRHLNSYNWPLKSNNDAYVALWKQWKTTF